MSLCIWRALTKGTRHAKSLLCHSLLPSSVLAKDAAEVELTLTAIGAGSAEDEIAAAQRAHDDRAMRVIELKCDGVAVVSLQLLGYKPTLYLSGLQRIQLITKRLGRSSSIVQSHPELVLRAQFSQRLINLLNQ